MTARKDDTTDETAPAYTHDMGEFVPVAETQAGRVQKHERGPASEPAESARALRDLYVVVAEGTDQRVLVRYDKGDRLAVDHLELPTIPAVRDATGNYVPADPEAAGR